MTTPSTFGGSTLLKPALHDHVTSSRPDAGELKFASRPVGWASG